MTRYHIKKNWIGNIIFVLLCFCVFFGVRYSLMPVIVLGESMSPSYYNHDLLIGSKLSYKNSHPEKGDVVVIDGNKYGLEVTIIKRIIATEDDTIFIKSGKVFVNGKEIHEDYISEKPFDNFKEIKVKKNQVFVMGDNRNHSIDSRVFGCVSINDIQSKIIIDSPIITSLGHLLDFIQ